MTFTCIATAEQSPSFRFIWVNGSSSVIVQDGSSTIYTTSPLDYKNYNNYKAMFQCISYNRAGKSPPQTLVLDIQGNHIFFHYSKSMDFSAVNLIWAFTYSIRNQRDRNGDLNSRESYIILNTSPRRIGYKKCLSTPVNHLFI